MGFRSSEAKSHAWQSAGLAAVFLLCTAGGFKLIFDGVTESSYRGSGQTATAGNPQAGLKFLGGLLIFGAGFASAVGAGLKHERAKEAETAHSWHYDQ